MQRKDVSFDNFLYVYRVEVYAVTGGKPRGSADRYEKCNYKGLVMPKTRDKWLKVSYDAGSALT